MEYYKWHRYYFIVQNKSNLLDNLKRRHSKGGSKGRLSPQKIFRKKKENLKKIYDWQ